MISLALAVILTPDVPAAPTPAEPSVEAAGEQFRRIINTPSELSKCALDRLLTGASAAEIKERRETTQLVLGASADDARKLHDLLHRRTKIPAGDYKRVLASFGAQVPDHRGRFTEPPPQAVELDWLEALVALDPSHVSAHLRSALAETLVTVAVMRALAGTRHHDASISLLRFAYRHGGAFKDESGRQIRAMKVHAVPGLIRARALKDPLAFKMRRYASYQLDRMDMTRGLQVLKRADPELQTEILHAYGEVRTGASVNAVLAYTNARSANVRQAARWAMLRYVSGRPPRVVKRKLKLAGGRQTSSERAVYLTYRQLATSAIIERLARELGGKPGGPSERDLRERFKEEEEPRHLAEQLFEHFDHERERAQHKQLAAAMQRARDGKLEQAIATFDHVLAEDPYHPERAVMAGYYNQRGRQLLARGKTTAAIKILTKAIHLDPGGKFVNGAKASRALAEAQRPGDPDGDRHWQLLDALAYQPDHPRARSTLEQLRRTREQRVWLAVGLGTGAAGLMIVALLLVRRRLR